MGSVNQGQNNGGQKMEMSQIKGEALALIARLESW